MGRSYNVVGFLDESVVGREFGDKPEMFKIEAGRKDYIRILTPPVQHWVHSIPTRKKDGTDTVFWLACTASPEVIAADDLEKQKSECPACASGFELKDRYVMMIVWIMSEKAGHKTRRLQVLPWSVPANRYTNIRELALTLPADTSMQKQDIRVIGEDTNWQKATLMLNNTQMVIPPEVMADIAENHLKKDANGKSCNPGEIDSWIVLCDLLAFESKRDMMTAIRRAQLSTGGTPAQSDQVRSNAPAGAGGGAVSDSDPLAALAGNTAVAPAPNDDAPQGTQVVSSGVASELDELLGTV